MNQRLTASITGRVQGVSFRYYTCLEARQLGLTGWVRNEHDGSVTAVAEGPTDQLQQLERFLHQGPTYAQVESVNSEYSASTGEFTSFETRYQR
ncbi:MAG: acylphosphatase [Anaerolineales bacterium]|nr:acylphosphatase [Anaerolineales bacterium]